MKLLDRLRESFAKTLRVPEGQAAPVAIVWTDATGEWMPLAPMLRALMPEFFTLGDYRPEERIGPAIWLKCIVDRTLQEAPPPGATPILYLPHVSRQTLRAAADCPAQWA
ncbi:MAG: BREX-1 system phosphatase PglZ type B, partial [Planctomycetota bacterium]